MGDLVGMETTEVARALDGVEDDGKSVLADEAWVATDDFVHEPPVMKVTQPKGSFCQIDARFSVALPPDGVYNIITDPNNRRVFKNIKVSWTCHPLFFGLSQNFDSGLNCDRDL